MKRIVFTLINDLTYDQRMHRIAYSLTQAGYGVSLIGRLLPHSIPLESKPYQQSRLRLLFRRGKAFYLEYNLRLLLFLLRSPFDAVCATDLDTLPACFLAAFIKGKKCIYDAHEIFPEMPEVVRRPLVQQVWRWAERYLVPRVRQGYTVSSGLSRYFQNQYGVCYEVIRNVPLLHENAAPIPNTRNPHEPPIIIYQGALNEGRGLECLIAVMAQIPAQLWLAGEGDLSQQLRALVQRLGVQEKVRFLGRIPPAQLPSLTRTAYVGVNLLSGPSLNYRLSLANKFFDYVHAAVPQVTMNYEEYRRHNEEFEVALLIDRTESHTVHQALMRLLTDLPLYQHLHRQCLLARQHWNWQQEQQKLLQLYRRWL
ncbi:MAG: glycosyltransferase [Chitinophagales bacterium]|nr:glycosyltransferase [Chitinophagales bacterium]MDW8427742.1 glycosyltransferase [Chitinophagales bacterium]